LINHGGFVKIADVDTLDDGRADVVLLEKNEGADGDEEGKGETETELSVKESALLLPLPAQKSESFTNYDDILTTLQSVLFNSSRSLSRLSRRRYASLKTSQSFAMSGVHVVSLGLGVVDWRRRVGREEGRRRRIEYDRDDGEVDFDEREEILNISESKGRYIRGEVSSAMCCSCNRR